MKLPNDLSIDGLDTGHAWTASIGVVGVHDFRIYQNFTWIDI